MHHFVASLYSADRILIHLSLILEECGHASIYDNPSGSIFLTYMFLCKVA